MINYENFLRRWAGFSAERSISWAVIGSHAMVAHARIAGIEPRREAHDLDLIVLLPRIFDIEFRAWIDRRSMWVYERWGLGAIHLWCDDGSQVDFFVKPDAVEIDRAVQGEVLGMPCRVVSKVDLLGAVERWARDAEDPRHVKYADQQKYQADADWIRKHLIP